MKKPIITLLCAMSLAFSAPSFALTVKKGAPQRYTVKKGDTLWGISGMYLNRPYKWPKLWGMNKSQIKNPHLIYPGQVLVLKYVNGQPRLTVEGAGVGGNGSVIKLSPRTHDITDGYAISTLPMSVVRSFMDHPSVLSAEEIAASPVLIAGPEKHLLYSIGDRVYADGVAEPGRYLTYRVNGAIVDPETKLVLGQEVVYSGEVATIVSKNGGPKVRQTAEEREVLGEGKRYHGNNVFVRAPAHVAQPMEVIKTASEIKEGDRLKYVPANSNERFNFAPHEPEVQVRARIVKVFNGVDVAGRYQTVVFNKGELNGVDRGTVLSVYKKPEAKGKRNSDGKLEYTIIPVEEKALAIVYRTSGNLAYAVLIDAENEAAIGDIVANPGLDLEDVVLPREDHTEETSIRNRYK